MLDIPKLPPWTESSLRPGDVLVQLPDDTLFGHAIRDFGAVDARAKDVPLAMHTLLVTDGADGKPGLIESWFMVLERDLALDPGVFVVLRPACTPEQVVAAIRYGRAQRRRFYGFANLLRLYVNLYLPPFLRLKGSDGMDPVCSQLTGECFDQAGFPVPGFGQDSDCELKPWDYFRPEVLARFVPVGRIDKPTPTLFPPEENP